MPLWLWLLESFGTIVSVAILLLVGLILRRRILARGGSVFDLSVNHREGSSMRGWTLGVGRYTDTHLEWFRVFSLAWRPRHRFQRGHVLVLKRRDPVGNEAFSLHADHVIVECDTEDGPMQFGLDCDALTGMLAWLESAPPGRDSNRVI